MNYLEWIDQQIHKHQTEIARLEIARSVIAEAAPRQPKVVRKPSGKRYRLPGVIRDVIIAALGDKRPLSSREIVTAVKKTDPSMTDKRVWNILFNMRIAGQVVRDAAGNYNLPPTTVVGAAA